MSSTSYNLIIINSAPVSDAEPIDMALALAAFDQPTTLLFSGPGIYWLINHQAARKAGGKSPSRLIAALPMYECDAIYYSSSDRDSLCLAAKQLSSLASAVSDDTIKTLIASSHHCLSF
ncbi:MULTISPECIES: DsrE family protein [unclassified Oceanobacter]|uniref:DsrE family protein n=1 Tax=unclassified Oceanobacter TaxID=2620260 RepID=UPI00273251D2|nr:MULTISPECIES: DsrE family protein [unclassified Oceanobacter]MDP2608741.1 DsrE family protein [Oceanobacter sp. 1_MG-2023]MDP2611837.1 DsrE family protein [Oceanobacter sp. 2_MG-2023]